jgi:hypothetical protein
MEQSNDVTQNPSSAVSEDVTPQTQLPVAPVVTQVPATQPGSKTPPENLYAALAEERRMRQEAEDKLKQLETTDLSEPEVISDEAKILKGQIDTLSVKINQLEDDKVLEKLFVQYPVLKENIDKFNEFRRTEHPRAKIESAAKIYLAENGLLEGRRVGLENPTGGGHAPVSQGMTAEDVANLRKNNHKKYTELLMKGLIKIEA